MNKEQENLIDKIHLIMNDEIENNPVTYNTKTTPYQAYERIGFKGLRWSVEKRIKEYRLEQFFNQEASILDIGSNFGFFVSEFAIHCKIVHGIEPNTWLNDIGELTAKYLGVNNKVQFFDTKFINYSTNTKYDTVLCLASFFTQDKRERSDANEYFLKINSLLKEKGYLFYESTSYTKDEDNLHYKAQIEAIRAIKNELKLVEEWETISGSEGYFRKFAIATKIG
jgi:hypothetical protein